MMERHIVSVSGGKDSAATYLLAIETGVEFDAVFADTGNEHEITYEFVKRLHEKTGGPPVRFIKNDFSKQIEKRKENLISGKYTKKWCDQRRAQVIKRLNPTGVPFLDLCLWKGRFPSTKRRFCSEELKHRIIYDAIHEPALDAGYRVVSWQGVRAEESGPRSCLPMREPDPRVPEIINYRPIIGWTVDDVFRMHRRHGLRPNDLYKMGFGRVGCMPCIHSTKAEIRNIAKRFPWHIRKIFEWENKVSSVSKKGVSTMFSSDKTPGVGDTRSSIEKVVDWSKTTRGGRQFMLPFKTPINQCASLYGLCE